MLAALRDQTVRDKFAVFAEETFVKEAARFLNEAIGYKEYFYDRSREWRVAKAQMIMVTFVQENSPLQINVSHATRVKTEGTYEVSGPKYRLFDDAVHEVAETLRFSQWRDFVEKELSDRW